MFLSSAATISCGIEKLKCSRFSTYKFPVMWTCLPLSMERSDCDVGPCSYDAYLSLVIAGEDVVSGWNRNFGFVGSVHYVAVCAC